MGVFECVVRCWQGGCHLAILFWWHYCTCQGWILRIARCTHLDYGLRDPATDRVWQPVRWSRYLPFITWHFCAPHSKWGDIFITVSKYSGLAFSPSLCNVGAFFFSQHYHSSEINGSLGDWTEILLLYIFSVTFAGSLLKQPVLFCSWWYLRLRTISDLETRWGNYSFFVVADYISLLIFPSWPFLVI